MTNKYEYVLRVDIEYKEIFRDMEFYLKTTRKEYIKDLLAEDKDHLLRQIDMAKKEKANS